ncbi:MAG: NAD-dependent epimerase/dehydratase family protein [Chthoniobacterales bacterium]
MKGQRALLTGAHGFSGRHLAAYLQTQAIETVALSARGARLTDVAWLREQLLATAPHYIFHLAGVATAASIQEQFQVNTLYAAALLEAAVAAGLTSCPFLLVGTAAEYGRVQAEDLPLKEEAPCSPYSVYGISKLAQTHLGLMAAARGQAVVVARPFNILGPGMLPHLALAAFQQQLTEIKEQKRPPILKTGNLAATRDFIHVHDVVRLYWALVQEPEACGQIFNLCTGVGTSLRAALEMLVAANGLEVEIESDQGRLKEVDVPFHFGSNARLHSLLGDFTYKSVTKAIEDLVG